MAKIRLKRTKQRMIELGKTMPNPVVSFSMEKNECVLKNKDGVVEYVYKPDEKIGTIPEAPYDVMAQLIDELNI